RRLLQATLTERHRPHGQTDDSAGATVNPDTRSQTSRPGQQEASTPGRLVIHGHPDPVPDLRFQLPQADNLLLRISTGFY
ncbi:MAG TPA: hypothetical protein VN408_21180, partial [Actinoplanes sp.]|nr:hypothetical protein [Actinoplanes sp.]